MDKERLDEIVAIHGRWIQDKGGKHADLRGADLRGADLRYAYLKRADLRGANLYGANLYGADLRGVDLYGTNLRGANLKGADLFGANLCGAKLEGANLNEADLRRAKLEGAYLDGANLEVADLEGAELPIGIYQIVGAGRCNRCTTYDSLNDQVVCGCWDDGAGNHLDSFEKRIEEIYGAKGEEPNLKYYTEYMSAVAFFKAMKELNND